MILIQMPLSEYQRVCMYIYSIWKKGQQTFQNVTQDELLEVSPENLRIRKQILNHEQRMKAKSKMK